MSKIPTAEEVYILFQDKDYLGVRITHQDRCIYAIREFARLHVQAALNAASEKAVYTVILDDNNNIHRSGVCKQSILNAYTLDNIK